MSYHFGVRFSLLSFILGGYLSVSSIDVKDLRQSKCRIAGVVLVENQDRSQKFNYTVAESACQELGLQLASKAQVEKAKGYGYETCSYGWVSEQVGVIPRIQNNENCGRNKTGVLTWKVDLNKMFFSAYCFNASDIQINSCKPGLMVTQPPSSSAAVPTSGSTMASTSAKTETQTEPRETSTPPVWTTWKASTTSLHTTLVTTVKPARSTTALQTTPTPDTIPPTKQENQMAQKSERVVFGGLPTTLLVLALLFFIAAVVLAICYIKKYKTHLLFTKKKKEKELVEAKVFKDASGAENTKEQYTNGKEAECLQNPTGNSIEAEV